MQRPASEHQTSHVYPSLLNAQYSNQPADPEIEADRQAQLNGAIEQQYRDWPRSSYKSVDVLLLRWAADNLGVITEVRKFESLLRDRFKFTTEIWDIPSDDPEDTLIKKVLDFRKGKNHGSLILLYYAGHGSGDPQECIWSATDVSDSPSLNWHEIQPHLLDRQADVCLILDCCYASLAAASGGRGRNWFLGASPKESKTLGASWRSFTSAMIRSLERAANKYWSDKENFNIQSLKHDLDLWERDLTVTPNLVRLTSHHCSPTDLTPLLYSRQRPMLASAITEPIHSQGTPMPQPPPIPRRPTLPQPQIDGARTDRKDIAIRHRYTSPERTQADECQTVRIARLPTNLQSEDVAKWLEGQMGLDRGMVLLGPTVRHSDSSTTTATFPNFATAKQASIRISGSMKVDNKFEGFTTLYSSLNAPDKKPNVDVIFVHGAYGHAINSFASRYTVSGVANVTTEACWPRDELPKILEAGGLYPRVLTYGWPADLWLRPKQDAAQATQDFLRRLARTRQAAPSRPLILVGHGLGGLLIKEIVNNAIIANMGEGNYDTPVQICCFLSVPHRGEAHEEDFAPILSAMTKSPGSMALSASAPPQQLAPYNKPLLSTAVEFETFCQEYGISTISVEESPGPEEHIVVPQQSVVLPGLSVNRISVEGNHRDIAKLPNTVKNRRDAIDQLGQKIIELLTPGSSTQLGDPSVGKRKEKVFGRLRKYDTVFLVDDSESMYGRRWLTTSRVLADVASIAVAFDQDGVDVKFFNAPDEGNDLTTRKEVLTLFSQVDPDGPTLTADILDAELNEYIYEYEKDRQKKGLNLIVLTDGEPEKGQDVESVIVKYADMLRSVRAPPFQVGIQFVQIGADKDATKFLKRLDSKLKGEHGLDRDMVDTVQWVPGDENHLFEKILLGGILKQLDNEDEEDD
ncbi:MAG: hypothetical protein Q9220_002446 [cf. Caloplaca sp. 1 TL-2023]